MQKLLRTIAMFLVIATVVFAAGCAEQSGKKQMKALQLERRLLLKKTNMKFFE